MTHIQTIILYGNSLVASSIGAGLRACQDFRVLPLDVALPDAVEQLSALRPHVVIFDLATTQPDFAIALWKARPGLLSIGVDLETGQNLMLYSQASHSLTSEDVLQLIANHAKTVER